MTSAADGPAMVDHHAAERALKRLGEAARESLQTGHVDRLREAFTAGMSLSLIHGHSPDWLIAAGRQLADAGYWSDLDVRIQDGTSLDQTARAMAAGFRGVALRRRGRLPDSLNELDRCLDNAQLPKVARRYFTLHRANSRRNSSLYDEAEADYRQLAEGSDEDARSARYQLADLTMLRGRFQECAEATRLYGDEDAYLAVELLRLRGHTQRFSGQFRKAEGTYRAALDRARGTGSAAGEGKALTNLAECLCWIAQDTGRAAASLAVEFNRDIGNRLEVIKGMVARAVATATKRQDEAALSLSDAYAVANQVGYTAGTLFCNWAAAYRAVLQQDLSRLDDAVDAMECLADRLGAYSFLVDIVQLWRASLSGGSIYLNATVEWLDGPRAATDAWLAPLARGD